MKENDSNANSGFLSVMKLWVTFFPLYTFLS